MDVREQWRISPGPSRSGKEWVIKESHSRTLVCTRDPVDHLGGLGSGGDGVEVRHRSRSLGSTRGGGPRNPGPGPERELTGWTLYPMVDPSPLLCTHWGNHSRSTHHPVHTRYTYGHGAHMYVREKTHDDRIRGTHTLISSRSNVTREKTTRFLSTPTHLSPERFPWGAEREGNLRPRVRRSSGNRQ